MNKKTQQDDDATDKLLLFFKKPFVLFCVCNTVVRTHPHTFVKHALSPCDCKCNKVDSCSLMFGACVFLLLSI